MDLLIPQIDATESFLFSIVPGERALLLGPNGAGKSRLGAYIESELSKNIIQNNTNNTTRNDNNDYSIEQQITEKQQEIESIKSTPIEFLTNAIRNHQNSPFHPFIPNSLTRKQILELFFKNQLPNLHVEFANASVSSMPLQNLDDISGGTINISGVTINVDLMKADPTSHTSVTQFVLKNISNLEQQIEDLKLRKLGFVKIADETKSKENNIKFCLRISGHRSLIFNKVISIEEPEIAQRNLIGDVANIHQKWNGKPTGGLQADFDKVLVALISDEVNASVAFKQSNMQSLKPETKLDLVVKSWNELLPTRKIKTAGTDVKITSFEGEYKLDQCSEGEKSIFYILGQCVNAPEGSLIIIDEPEIHINKSILPSLFDRIESTRPDCAFLYITHDIDFSKSRSDSKNYIIKNYIHPNKWNINLVDSSSDIPKDIILKIAGSRKPILFCEGNENSLDNLYKKIYPDFTVIPVQSCKDVINLTTSLNNNGITGFHHLNCHGIIDGDNQERETPIIKQIKIGLLENIFLIPDIAKILHGIFHEKWPGDQEYINLVVSWAKSNSEWRRKNMIDISRNSMEYIISNPPHDREKFLEWVDNIDLSSIKKSMEEENLQWEDCVAKATTGNIFPLLKIHRGKGLIARLASQLNISGKKELLKKIMQINNTELIDLLRKNLPHFNKDGNLHQ